MNQSDVVAGDVAPGQPAMAPGQADAAPGQAHAAPGQGHAAAGHHDVQGTTGSVSAKAATPRTAAVWAVLAAELAPGQRRVIDLGGGTGGFAVPLAEAGHRVTVIDPSPDALAALARRAAESGVSDRIRGLQGDADSIGELAPRGEADLVLCHAVLEVVDDPATVLTQLAATLRPGGALSLLVANRVAAVLSRAITGHFAAAAAILAGTDTDGRRRFDEAGATALLTAAGLKTEHIHGVRVIADLVSGAVADADQRALIDLELAASGRSPYREIATQLHLLARLC